MDHSYRAALAGGNNGKKSGRQRPGFAPQYPQPEPEPLPASDDANSRIFAFVDDMFFLAKIFVRLNCRPRSMLPGLESSMGAAYTPDEVKEILGSTRLCACEHDVAASPFDVTIAGIK